IDTIYRFYAPDQDVLNLVNQYVSHLLIDAPGLPDIELSVAKTDRRYILYKNKKPVDWCSHISSVVPALHATIIMNTYNKTTCLMGIHAAVVVRNNICILMPAKANSGKSTITTALIHSGFTYGADDFVLLTSEPGKIIPVPSAIGLKKGSWPVIEKYHPKIRSCPVHKRSDDKMIKYLPPSEKENCYYTSLKPINVDYIVYPHYNPEYPLSLNKINPAQSICDLSTAGFYMHDKLDKERVRQLVDWMKITPSYRLGFSRLENAVTRLKSLCGSEGRERLSKFS
ncbi:MAG: hypothetical protein PF495_14005, partial [Spirochaetales bacterium]|nr:hypothetical protein [Spirochaetales bacterium]